MFAKRIGQPPQANGVPCAGCHACPDIWELDDGDFAIIGSDMTHEAARLPPDAGCAPHERIVRIPRRLLVNAKRDIPDPL
jgi:hypothetical protein